LQAATGAIRRHNGKGTAMDALTTELPNGATWIRDCLLGSPEMAKACHRLHENSPKGIRHFSSIGKAVPLEQAGSVEIEISRLEKDEERDLRLSLLRF
jgi:hypothetical protein